MMMSEFEFVTAAFMIIRILKSAWGRGTIMCLCFTVEQ
jgi:hypothetical protein